MADPPDSPRHIALLTATTLLLLTQTTIATPATPTTEPTLIRQTASALTSIATMPLLLLAPAPHETHQTAHPLPPRGIYFTNTLSPPITVPLAPPKPVQSHQTVNPRAVSGTANISAPATGGSEMRSADGANEIQTLTSTETLEPTTITITLAEANCDSGMSLSSPLLNGTAVSVATHASEGTLVSTSSLASASSLDTTGSTTIDEQSKCSDDADCVGGGKKEAKALVDSAGGRRLGEQWVVVLLCLLACLWLLV